MHVESDVFDLSRQRVEQSRLHNLALCFAGRLRWDGDGPQPGVLEMQTVVRVCGLNLLDALRCA